VSPQAISGEPSPGPGLRISTPSSPPTKLMISSMVMPSSVSLHLSPVLASRDDARFASFGCDAIRRRANGTDATGALLDGLEGDCGADVSGSHYGAEAVKVSSLLQSR
jgi:hypothetical protein